MSRSAWGRARRPQEIVEATRWLFAVLVLVTLLFAIPALLATASRTVMLVGLVSAGVLGLSWSAGYLRRSAPLAWDVVDSLAFLGFALALPDPMAAVGVVVTALWFRSLYGSAARATLRASLYAVAISAGLLLWALVPGRSGGAEVAVLVGVVPAMFLTVIASRQLAAGLRARTQAARRDAVHMSLGSELLGVTDSTEILRVAWVAMSAICEATPGLRVVKVVRQAGVLRVEVATDGFPCMPATLPATVVSLRGGGGPPGSEVGEVGYNHAELDAAAGTPCVWTCLPLPSDHTQHGSAWLVLGAPRTLPPEAVVAVGTVANQVALALRNGEVHEKLTLLAEVDSLTGLANRASFNAALALALDDKSSGSTTVLFVDLDDFKDVNDALGHGAGDELLHEVAVRLRRATRPGDLCARLGGDEFAVLLVGTEDSAAVDVANRIVSEVGAGMSIGGAAACVGASIGVATATSETDLDELIHRADVAMYAAKAKGKARIQVFEPDLLHPGASHLAASAPCRSRVKVSADQ